MHVIKGRALIIASAHLDMRPFLQHLNPWWPLSRTVQYRIHSSACTFGDTVQDIFNTEGDKKEML